MDHSFLVIVDIVSICSQFLVTFKSLGIREEHADNKKIGHMKNEEKEKHPTKNTN